jgi:hypothetical protein
MTDWNACGVVGKSVESVTPVTQAEPLASTAIPQLLEGGVTGKSADVVRPVMQAAPLPSRTMLCTSSVRCPPR